MWYRGANLGKPLLLPHFILSYCFFQIFVGESHLTFELAPLIRLLLSCFFVLLLALEFID